MVDDEEVDLLILDELARRGRCTLEELREVGDFDASGILDDWDSIANGPGGESRVERFLAAISADRDGPVRFAQRVERLVVRGLIERAATRYRLTEAGEAFRRSFD